MTCYPEQDVEEALQVMAISVRTAPPQDVLDICSLFAAQPLPPPYQSPDQSLYPILVQGMC